MLQDKCTNNKPVCQKIFQDVWVSVANPGYSDIIDSIESASTIEEFVNTVALSLFPASDYIKSLETSLLQGIRQESVLQTQHSILHRYARYRRISLRRGRSMVIQQSHINDCIYSSLPIHLEYPIRTHFISASPTPHEIIGYAFHIEQEIKRCQPSRAALPVYPSNTSAMEDVVQGYSSPPSA